MHIIFADTLTLLFEGIARTVEIHQPLIETFYGPGRLLKGDVRQTNRYFFLALLIFCIYVVLTVLQEECDRQSERILAEFAQKRALKSKVSRVRDALYKSSSAGPQDKIEAKELDHVLSEMVLLQARSEMYYKFIRKRVTVSFFSIVLAQYLLKVFVLHRPTWRSPQTMKQRRKPNWAPWKS